MGFGHPPMEEAGCAIIAGVVLAVPATALQHVIGPWALLVATGCCLLPVTLVWVRWYRDGWRHTKNGWTVVDRNDPDDTDSSSRRDGGR